MENEVRQRKLTPFLEDLRRNDVEMEFESVSVEIEMGKIVNSHKNSREKLKKF